MIDNPFEQITKTDIDALITNAVREGRTIEYKAVLPGNSDNDKKEFLADVSSCANASGGDLLLGIAAADGVPTDARGIPGLNIDAETLRLESVIRDGIEPRIPGIRIRAIEGFAEGPVLLVRIPKSWGTPHMVTYKGTSRFYARDNAGKHQMDVMEIRASFMLSGLIPERMRNLRIDRLSKVVANEGPVALIAGPKTVLHLVPFSAFSAETQLSPTEIGEAPVGFQPLAMPETWRYNLDGFLSLSRIAQPSQRPFGYCQVFRSGIVEWVDGWIMEATPRSRTIPGSRIESEIVRSLGASLHGLRRLNVAPPLVVMVALLGVRNYEFAVPQGWDRFDHTPIDRNELILPEVLIEDYDGSVASRLRPAFDAMWNASGWPRSPNFTPDGKWTPP